MRLLIAAMLALGIVVYLADRPTDLTAPAGEVGRIAAATLERPRVTMRLGPSANCSIDMAEVIPGVIYECGGGQ